MHKFIRTKKDKEAFTLIEVMVAVMIISLVILAMIQMFANNTFIFSNFKKQTNTNQYLSFLVASPNYGYEDKSISLYRLVEDFKLKNELRRTLEKIKIKLIYQKIEKIDLSDDDMQVNEDQRVNEVVSLEVGKTILRFDDTSSGLMRFRLIR